MNEQFGSTLTDLAMHASDNLMEREIAHLKMNKKSVFPGEMLSSLCQMRETYRHTIIQIFSNDKGNLSSSQVYPERIFSTLSAGEKKRLICLLALELVKRNSQVNLIIFDEPLAHLDVVNIQEQIDTIKQIQQIKESPALLIISHSHIDDLTKVLANVQHVKID